MLPSFSYVGPPDLAAEAANAGATGCCIRTPDDLDRWAATLSPAELDEPFTYVVALAGTLRLAPRRSEHVACARGADVLAAGEIALARRTGGGWVVSEASNQSTGYCPDLNSWPALAIALDRIGIARPDSFTHAFIFRRCPECGQDNVVKDEDFSCAVCGGMLPKQWNLDPTNATALRPVAAVINLPVPDDESAGQLAQSLRSVDNEPFLQAVSGRRMRLHHRSIATLVSGPDQGPFAPASEPTWSLMLRAVHLSFAAHLPLSLSPDVVWFTVIHEVAVHVQLNADHYAGVFTDTPGRRQTIQIHDDSLLAPEPDWSRSIHLVLEPLREKLGAEVTDLFLPRFSTTTPDDVSSALVALMSVVSPYYRFAWHSSCGIPRIRLEGTADDWKLLVQQVRELASWFDGLRPWFDALCPVLDEIATTAAGGTVDKDFWSSLYKWDSQSGGDYVSGWITVLFAHTQTPAGPQPKESFRWRCGERYLENAFPSHVAKVPFHWTRPEEALEMQFMSGILGIERDGDYLRPRLAHAVTELLPAGAAPPTGSSSRTGRTAD